VLYVVCGVLKKKCHHIFAFTAPSIYHRQSAWGEVHHEAIRIRQENTNFLFFSCFRLFGLS
jgi:hypothetical protein